MSYKIADPAEMLVQDTGQVAHPGLMIRSEIEAKGLTVEAAALHIGMDADQLEGVLAGEQRVDPDIADHLATLFGEPFGDLVYRWQLRHD